MSCLLLRFVAPMQSWGSRSRFQERDTEREPTKSGVIGLICAALGRDRSEPLDDLVDLLMGVRVDREGIIKKDFQTAQDVIKADASGKDTQTSSRDYLCDAAFLVGLEGDKKLLVNIVLALKNPVWPIFLGRKAFLPSLPLLTSKVIKDCIKDDSLELILKNYPVIVPFCKRLDQSREKFRLVMESKVATSGERRQDVPLSFDYGKRRFFSRYVATSWVSVPDGKEAQCISVSFP